MKIKLGIILLLIIFLFSILLLMPSFFSQNNVIAEIYQDGILIKSIDLSNISAPYNIPIVDENKENIILVERGCISISSASCPDQTCVNQGKITTGVVPIVCLPHRLVIELKEKIESPDIISR